MPLQVQRTSCSSSSLAGSSCLGLGDDLDLAEGMEKDAGVCMDSKMGSAQSAAHPAQQHLKHKQAHPPASGLLLHAGLFWVQA